MPGKQKIALHPDNFRNDRNAKEVAMELAEQYSGYDILGFGRDELRIPRRRTILSNLEIRASRWGLKLPQEDKDFWKEVILELKKIPDLEKDEEDRKNATEYAALFEKHPPFLWQYVVVFVIAFLFFPLFLVFPPDRILGKKKR
jgi:hypothetical protein